MTGRRLDWEEFHTKKLWHCYNGQGEHLGMLEYERVGAHMHWCWYQLEGIRMSPGCLEEVREKQKELFKEVRK